MSTDFAHGLQASLLEAGEEKTAEGAKRYLKSDLEHYGVLLPVIRKLVRSHTLTRTPFDHDDLVTATWALWHTGVHECRIAAGILLERQVGLLGPADTRLLEELLRDSETWALVDMIAGSVAGRLLLAEPAVEADYRRWAAEEHLWIRRSGILAFLLPINRPATYQTYFPVVTELSDPLLADPRFFIRKAIGWVLRQAGKKHPQDVYDWIAPRAHRASGVTVREAVRYLSPAQREAILDAYRQGNRRGEPE
jgi:3-methyladenine DNA glycosylase AlkD